MLNKKLVELIKRHSKLLIFTGAGISTNSGIPDYRGPQGIWRHRQPVYYQDFMSSEKARVEYWASKMEGWDGFRDAKPNEAHKAIYKLETSGKLSMVVTQNIDGLHALAGTSEDKLVEIHGSNLDVECQSCWLKTEPEPHFAVFRQTGKAPLCEQCGGYLKPATISFGQSLRKVDLNRAAIAANQADMVIALGSTLSVYPAASFPLSAAQRGAPYVIINRGETEHDHHPAVALRLEGDVGEIFPQAVDEAV